MLIDGGVTETYSGSIKQELQEIRSAGEKIDLVVCTHMDNDHISGLVKMLKDHNADVIGNVWYNGFLQIIEEKFYLKRNVSNNEGCLADQKILDHIIRQGMISDEQQMVGINEGMSFGVLLEKEKLPVNEIVEGCAISTDNLQHKISINKDTAIYLIGPSKMDLDRVENYWKTDMIARNYRFRVSNQIKLTEAFEYQLERIQNFFRIKDCMFCSHHNILCDQKTSSCYYTILYNLTCQYPIHEYSLLTLVTPSPVMIS